MSAFQKHRVCIVKIKSENEQRSHQRVHVFMEAELYGQGNCVKPLPAIVKNVSLGGLCLTMAKGFFEVGDELDIYFTFFVKDKLILKARVVRVLTISNNKGSDVHNKKINKIEYGIEYFNLTETNKEKLKTFLHTLL